MTHNKHDRIWNTIAQIPEGNIAGYGHIATLAGLPGRARMVGKVIGLAPKELQLPWQRVLRSSGEIAFTAHSTMANKQAQLLRQEGVMVENNRVRMSIYQWQPTLEELFALGYEEPPVI
jgi:O(6)-alkylguanine repair protein YbaZ